jgi:hypothetical protein
MQLRISPNMCSITIFSSYGVVDSMKVRVAGRGRWTRVGVVDSMKVLFGARGIGIMEHCCVGDGWIMMWDDLQNKDRWMWLRKKMTGVNLLCGLSIVLSGGYIELMICGLVA